MSSRRASGRHQIVLPHRKAAAPAQKAEETRRERTSTDSGAETMDNKSNGSIFSHIEEVMEKQGRLRALAPKKAPSKFLQMILDSKKMADETKTSKQENVHSEMHMKNLEDVTKAYRERTVLLRKKEQSASLEHSNDSWLRMQSNFKAHGKEYTFAHRSTCCCLGPSSKLRQSCIWVITQQTFDNIVLGLILINSVVMALQDYSKIDFETGEPLLEGSFRNQLVESAEYFFMFFFAVECGIKIIAMGFILDAGSYLRHPWNWLDFSVVLGSLLQLMDVGANMSSLRAVRVLRPLRSLTIIPGMRIIVESLIAAVPKLLNVIALLLFVFAFFGILGIQILGGVLHSRCRVTPFPVALPPAGMDRAAYVELAQMNPHLYRCNASHVPEPTEVQADLASRRHPLDVDVSGVWQASKSPWASPASCFWPMDMEDMRVCGGAYACPENRWCGSSYDSFGNPRFTNRSDVTSADFVPERSWGVVHFDHMGGAFITIFQTITLEGWVDIMYNLMDGHSPAFASLYFVILIISI
eukprot:g5328.t1